MKIVLIGPAHPYRGGIAAYDERLARALIAQSHPTSILTFTTQYPPFLFPGKSQYTESPTPTDLSIVRSLSSINPISWRKTAKAIQRLAPDCVIYAHWMPFFCPAMGRLARHIRHKLPTASQIAVVHNALPHEPKPFDRSLTKYFLGQTDGLFALSRQTVETLQTLLPHHPCVFSPHPIYDTYGDTVDRAMACNALNIDASCRYILFFGFIRAYKGLDILMKAFAQSDLYSRGIRLLVAGEFYDNADNYARLQHRLSLPNDAILWHTHYISDNKIKFYFSSADIVAQPYRTATQSGVTQIAYHFERPMLVTRTGGLPEIVPHGEVGYVVDVQESAVSQALQDFFLHHTAEDFTPAIRREKQRFSWEAHATSLLSLIPEP